MERERRSETPQNIEKSMSEDCHNSNNADKDFFIGPTCQECGITLSEASIKTSETVGVALCDCCISMLASIYGKPGLLKAELDYRQMIASDTIRKKGLV